MNAIVLLLLAKITVLLAAAWLLHGALARQDPRWRVLLWRTTALGLLALSALSLCPPLMKVRLPSPKALSVSASNAGTKFEAGHGSAAARSTASSVRVHQSDLGSHAPPPRQTAASSPRGVDFSMVAADERRTVSADAATAPMGTQSISLATVALLVWACGVVAKLLSIAVGLAHLRRIRASATDVPQAIAAEAARIAASLGVPRSFGVRQTAELEMPCLIGLWRPLILLPHGQCLPDRGDELASILAHEIGHLKGNDAVFNALVHALSIVLWFHPLAWRARRAHSDACDGVCDALAAEYLGDVDLYARTLARIVLRVSRRKCAIGLAMARSSCVARRIAAVRRRTFARRLPRARAWIALAAFCAAIVLLGGATVTESDAETPANANAKAKADAEPARHRVTIHATDASGGALAGVRARFHGRIGGNLFDQTLETDENGLAETDWPAEAEIQNLWMTAEKPKFVAINLVWRSEQRKIDAPRDIELRFQPGNEIGGTVQDEAGRPIGGATLDMNMPVTWPRLANYVFTAATLKTDAQGRWHWSEAPSDLGGVGARVTHPDYLPGFSSMNTGMNNIAVLKQGLQVKGVVVDRQDRPLAGAAARLGFDRFGTNEPETITDAEGQFLLKNCKPGPSLVTVQAQGFSPTFQELTVSEATEPLRFQLEPGHTLQVQVVDVDGDPIPGAIVAADTWRGFRSLVFRANTDAEGKVVWRSAPDDVMLCDILQSGYMAVRRTPLKATDEMHAITLHPELAISGRVTDAATGKPIDHFGLRTGWLFGGRDAVSWSRDEATPFADGAYRIKFSEPSDGYVLQVVADGYQPATSRAFQSLEGEQTFDFALEPGSGPTGVVVLPDGSPAEGAEVGLATKDKQAFLREGHFDRSQNRAEVIRTDATGRFAFPPQGDEPFLLVVVHEAGFAERLGREMQDSKPISLEAWGRLEGVVRQGARPDANREVAFHPERPQSRRTFSYVWSYGYTTTTDEAGRFRFDRVVPGPGSAARVVVTAFLKSWQHTPGWQQRVEVEPGTTANVMIGGSGRPVVGRVKLPRQADLAVDWTTNEPATVEAWNKEKKQRAELAARFSANFDASGRFEIPDVPAGDYQLTIPVNNPPTPNACGAGTAIGRAELVFSVPAVPGGRSDEPLALGDVEAVLFDTLDAGELAPDFVAEQLSGGAFRLRELRGKLVLLDFWATWCQPCLAEMPNLEKLQEEFGEDARFALVGLSCDGDAAAARRYVEAKGLVGRQAHIGGTQSRVASQYTVRALPATFLIAPDGRVLAKNLRGDELRQAVAAALADEKLFSAAASAASRFPLVRFTPGEPKKLAAAPAVVVLDDADPDFDKQKPGGDRLRMLSAAGEELWATTGFNCGGSVGGIHCVAVDGARSRIYVAESVAERLVACGLDGQKLWQVENIEACAVAVDEKTGNVWCSGGPSLNDGETIVFDPSGNEVAAFPFRAIDLVYDPHDDCFWLAGYEILKLSREGKPLFRQRVDGWCCVSASVNPADGSVWLAEREHPDVPRSKNRAWLLAADGSVNREIDLGDFHLFAVACVPQTGDAWATGFSSGLRRISASGELGALMSMRAYGVAVGRTTGDVWVGGDGNILKLDGAGRIVVRLPLGEPSQRAWLAAF